MGNFSGAMIDVREAYRHIYEYQSKLLRAMQNIADKLEIEYSGGCPRFSNSAPSRDQGRLKNWAWDWINMYCYEFLFEIKNRKEYLSFLHVPDDGFYTSHHKKPEPLNLETYVDSEKSNSYLFVISGQWDNRENNINFITEDRNLFNGTSQDYHNNDEQKCFYKRYNIDELVNPDNPKKVNQTLAELKASLSKPKYGIRL